MTNKLDKLKKDRIDLLYVERKRQNEDHYYSEDRNSRCDAT